MPRTAKKIEPPTSIGGCVNAVNRAWGEHNQLRLCVGQLLEAVDGTGGFTEVKATPDMVYRIVDTIVRRAWDTAQASVSLWDD